MVLIFIKLVMIMYNVIRNICVNRDGHLKYEIIKKPTTNRDKTKLNVVREIENNISFRSHYLRIEKKQNFSEIE